MLNPQLTRRDFLKLIGAGTLAFALKDLKISRALAENSITQGLDFPKTHLLVHLMDILEMADMKIPKNVREADVLTQYAAQSRYPSVVEEVTRSEYRDALKLAAGVVFWAEKVIK